METFTFSTTQHRLNKIEKLNRYPSKSDFINKAIDLYVEQIETRYLSDFIYYIGFPLLGFLGFIGLTLYFATPFFYLCTMIISIYIIILNFLFFKKYKKVKN